MTWEHDREKEIAELAMKIYVVMCAGDKMYPSHAEKAFRDAENFLKVRDERVHRITDKRRA